MNEENQIQQTLYIDIYWEGPMNFDEVTSKNRGTDFGIYQVYGYHPIHGDNTLLYIGQANQQTFAERIPQHEDWFDWEGPEIKIYLGRIVGNEQKTATFDEWARQIDIAEAALIQRCQPVWNLRGFNNSIHLAEDYVIFNEGKNYKIPAEIHRTKRKNSAFANGSWKPFDNTVIKQL
jgi:hypothetical protein